MKMYNNIVYKKICNILAILVLAIIPCTLCGQEVSDSEIKASWIYTITDWIDWKDNSKNKQITICSTGRDKVYMYLRRIKQTNIYQERTRSFTIINKSPADNFDECDILYISNSEQEYHIDILEMINNHKNIVTISSIEGFAKHGGTIEFSIKKKARLIINLKSINNAKIIIDNDLYGWAETIYE